MQDLLTYMKTTGRLNFAIRRSNDSRHSVRDMGAGDTTFSGDYKTRFTVNVFKDSSTGPGANFIWPFMLGNLSTGWTAENAVDSHQIFFGFAGGQNITVYLRETNGGSVNQALVSSLIPGQNDLYYEIERDESIGANGQLQVYGYSDKQQTINALASPLIINLTEKKNFRYWYAMAGYMPFFSTAQRIIGFTQGHQIVSPVAGEVEDMLSPVWSHVNHGTEIEIYDPFIDIQSGSVAVENLFSNVEYSGLRKDFGAGWFQTILIHDFELTIGDTSGVNAAGVIWALTNANGSREHIQYFATDNNQELVIVTGAGDIYLQEGNETGLNSSPSISLTPGIKYYIRVTESRDFVALKLDVFTDPDRLEPVAGSPVTLVKTKTPGVNWRFLWAINTLDTGTGGDNATHDLDLTIENLVFVKNGHDLDVIQAVYQFPLELIEVDDIEIIELDHCG
jgi:hypothetical protein